MIAFNKSVKIMNVLIYAYYVILNINLFYILD